MKNEQRSRIMRAVHSKDTAPEMAVRRLLHSLGYRYRLHGRDLPGKPDVVFASRRKVIFVHGCFWHGHECLRGARLPKTNEMYWKAKINRNRVRDARNAITLETANWHVLTIWECEVKKPQLLREKLVAFLSPGKTTLVSGRPT